MFNPENERIEVIYTFGFGSTPNFLNGTDVPVRSKSVPLTTLFPFNTICKNRLGIHIGYVMA